MFDLARRWGWTVALAAALALSALAAQAAVAAGPTPTRIQVGADPPQADGQPYVIEARIVAADGRGVNSVPLDFSIAADFFGPRQLSIGRATTDGQGRAQISYLPSWQGRHEVTVKFAGTAAFAASQGAGSFVSAVALAPHRDARSPLADFSSGLPYAVAVIVVAVWLTIAFALVGTVRGILADRAPATAPAAADLVPIPDPSEEA